MLLSQALRLEPGRTPSARRSAGPSSRWASTSSGGPFAAIVADVPDNDYAHYALGRCLAELGRGEEARSTCVWPGPWRRTRRRDIAPQARGALEAQLAEDGGA